METVSKKGHLQKPEYVGLYITKYENLDGTPKRPNENQMKAIQALYKKVDSVLKPILENYKKQEQEKKHVIRPKKKEQGKK